MTWKDDERQVLTGADGIPVMTYVRGERAGLPCADLAEVTGPGAVPAVLAGMPGWAVSGGVELGRALLAEGARVLRHAHGMRRELTGDLPPLAPFPAGPDGPPSVVPYDRDPRALLPAWRAAFGPGHPDHHPGGDEEAFRERLAPLLGGRVLGPVLPCSALAVDGGDRVVAGVIVTDREGQPWIADVFREPGPRYAGVGDALLRHVLADAAARGLDSLELAVTDGNPARRRYETLGFRLTGTYLTVIVPGAVPD
ncbi:GNAT family N-acetyltransferase [Streptomyces uncialis]|uniref:GNAT family N-acetyltransferase n=1 Tax=Streptomyces uncialis TaxID=1048205 RepID=UPI0009A0A8B7|nr:GNAT family N-acetyltransferase [Streptomyces uncialis]MCX4658250.1 GNAT family N-acetyltransferase [Streptomyces uncialis]WTE14835.1 GNAT family N-acetyltransferase [Streptomyces uncialis]